MALIELQDVGFGYGDMCVLRGFSLVVHEGVVTVLVGPSGSGKSTVLRLIAGLEAPQRGRIAINGDIVAESGRVLRPPERRGVSMVFQDLALWPHMTVSETLDFVLGSGLNAGERRWRIADALMAVGLQRHVDARPAQLSGGERQRLAIARAIVTEPRILLMDEPLANLDPPLRHTLLEEIRRLQRRRGLTILYVTHNQQEMFVLGDRAAVIHEGRIQQAGSPGELYARPESAFVASLLGQCAILPARLHDGLAETAIGTLPAVDSGWTEEQRQVFVVIRPEDVSVHDDGLYSGRVERVTALGGCFELQLGGQGWHVWARVREPPRPGASVRFAVGKTATVHG
jgi:iron(III) transport system ATP-binding protein